MKKYIGLAIVSAVLALAGSSHAQSCYSPVSSWQGEYSLSTSGSGSCSLGSCTIQQAVTATPLRFSGGASSCAAAQWVGADAAQSVSINNKYVAPCPEGGNITQVVTQTGGFADSVAIMNVSPSSSTFYYEPFDVANASDAASGCGGGGTTAVDYPMYPATNWPQTFPLPATVQTLSEAPPPFKAEAIGLTLPWTFSFTLTPIYDCKECRENGTDPGWILPVSSSIAPENGSLGEDLPIVGTPFQLHYESGRAPGAGKDAVATADAAALGGWTVSIHHAYDRSSNTLFLGDGTQRSGYELGTPVSLNGNYLITNEDGGEIYVFNGTSGAHVQTLRPMTGAVLYTFGYDSAGKLITITDNAGNITKIERNASEQPTAIVSPYGQTTTLSVDKNAFLSEIKDPLGTSSNFQNSSSGLIESRTDANGNTFNYSYDSSGKLIKDADPLGGYVSLAQTDSTSGFGRTVDQTTSMGRTSSFGTSMTLPWSQNGSSPVSEQHTNVWPNGLTATSSKSLNNGQLSSSVNLPDGTSDSSTSGPDPRWGIQVPVVTSDTLKLGTLSMSITGSRTASLGTVGNPFTLTTQTDKHTVNGRTYTSVFTTSTRAFVDTTPVGRKLTTVLDSKERISDTQIAGLTATSFAYDSRGRLSTVTQGTRKTTLAYDTDGRLSSVTDPLSLKTSFTYDADGHLLTTTLPDTRVIGYTYDSNGNLTSVTPPGKTAHDFGYTAVNQVSEYVPPSASGTGLTSYTYNLDRNITKITRPDGKLITFDYDNGGRVQSLITPTETIDYTYSSSTGNLTSASITSGEALAYGYNGPLQTSTKWTGTINGTVGLGYNSNFWVTSETINGANSIAYTYDNDGLVTKAGVLTLANSSQNGLLTGTTLGSATDTRTYNSFGEITGYTASYAGALLYAVTYTRDADGRISAKSETVAGKTNSYVYSYDLAGRLTSVSENGSVISLYAYDSNSNRLKGVTSSGTAIGTYDPQDRLLTYGSAAFTYTANGELATQTAGTAKTTYQYDVLGNLTGVTLPSGKTIAYVIDAKNRRVGKKVNGALVEGFLYDGTRIVAQLNASNAIVRRFVYGSGSTSPDYMIAGGVTYRIFSDQLGSPRLVVNTSTGAIAEQITYDEFGNVLSDSNPGFQPFGFAGGLYDLDTKLVRFGARDYNPAVGRWTTKDPILFKGEDTGLYSYVFQNPVNLIDPRGNVGFGLQSPYAGSNPFLPLLSQFTNPSASLPAVQSLIDMPVPFSPPAPPTPSLVPGVDLATPQEVYEFNSRSKTLNGCIKNAQDWLKAHLRNPKIPTSPIADTPPGQTGPGPEPPPEPEGDFEVDPIEAVVP